MDYQFAYELAVLFLLIYKHSCAKITTFSYTFSSLFGRTTMEVVIQLIILLIDMLKEPPNYILYKQKILIFAE